MNHAEAAPRIRNTPETRAKQSEAAVKRAAYHRYNAARAKALEVLLRLNGITIPPDDVLLGPDVDPGVGPKRKTER